jgi:predicted dehydrogenase
VLRVAIVGISGYGAILTDLLSSFAAEGKVRFVAATVVNRSEQSGRCDLLERQNVRVFADHREMLSASGPAIDLCLVPVGIPWHAPVAIDALEAGCHVLVEKPLAGDYADASRIDRVARETGKHLFVGFQDLCDPGVWEIKEALLAKHIGEIMEIRAAGAWPRPVGYFERNEWAGKVTLDGVAVHDSPHNNALSHLVNMAFFWAGERSSESGWAETVEGLLYRALPIESYDTGWIEWCLQDGKRVVCAASHASTDPVAPRISLHGTKGSMLWDYESGLVSSTIPLRISPRPDAVSLRAIALNSVFEILEGSPSLHCGARNALAHARAMDLAHRALPIRSEMREAVQVEYRDDGEYHVIPGLDAWCHAALRPRVAPVPLEAHLKVLPAGPCVAPL